MIGSSNATADIVPVDVCVNMMIAIGWHTAIKQYELNNHIFKRIIVNVFVF